MDGARNRRLKGQGYRPDTFRTLRADGGPAFGWLQLSVWPRPFACRSGSYCSPADSLKRSVSEGSRGTRSSARRWANSEVTVHRFSALGKPDSNRTDKKISKRIIFITRWGRWCQGRGLNSRPKAYESSALPLSYPGERDAEEVTFFPVNPQDISRCHPGPASGNR